MSTDCIFCKIIDGKIPSPRVMENDDAIVIRDINPQAKQHYLVIPKGHVPSLKEAFLRENEGKDLVARLFSTVNRLALQEKLLPDGYRSVINTGELGGQTVHHLHIHVMGGGQLKGFFG